MLRMGRGAGRPPPPVAACFARAPSRGDPPLVPYGGGARMRATARMLTLGEVLAASGGELRGASGRATELRFSRVVVDSRAVVPGALFVALRGLKHDGHAFVAQALAAGASGAIVERIPADCAWAIEPGAESSAARGVHTQDAGAGGPPLVLVKSTPEALAAMARFA